jgi:hypothetical protein
MSPSSNVYDGVGGDNHRSDVTYDHGNEISILSVCDNCLAYDAGNRLISRRFMSTTLSASSRRNTTPAALQFRHVARVICFPIFWEASG